jgi:hypothetical protein
MIELGAQAVNCIGSREFAVLGGTSSKRILFIN